MATGAKSTRKSGCYYLEVIEETDEVGHEAIQPRLFR